MTEPLSHEDCVSRVDHDNVLQARKEATDVWQSYAKDLEADNKLAHAQLDELYQLLGRVLAEPRPNNVVPIRPNVED